MRISTYDFQRQAVQAMQDNQSRLARTQLQVATGRRILTPSDDPSGAKRTLDLKQAIEIQKQYQRNADAALNRLSLEESALASVTESLQRIRELTVQAGNSTLLPQDRAAIAAEVEARLDELLALANVKDAQGEFLFAGYLVNQQPFTRAVVAGRTTYTYAGDGNERRLQVGTNLRISSADSGEDVFRAIPNGNGTFAARQAVNGTGTPTNTGTGVIDAGTVTNPAALTGETYTITFSGSGTTLTYDVVGSVSGLLVDDAVFASGAAMALPGLSVSIRGTPAAGDGFTVAPSSDQDLLQTVQNLVDALRAPGTGPAPGAHFQNEQGRALTDLDRALDHVGEVRAGIGARLNEVEAQQNIAAAFELFSRQSLSEVEDLDYAEATGRLQLQLTVLQASQQAFVKVQGLTLFNYL